MLGGLRSPQKLGGLFPTHPPLEADLYLLRMNSLSVENHYYCVGEEVAKLEPSHTVGLYNGAIANSLAVPQNVKHI